MSDGTGIEWTDATWNPVTGCTEVSPGCDHCYAKTFAERWRGTPGHHFEQGFDVVLRPERLDQPLKWRKPRRIFVNSMSDLFHDAVPDEYIARVFAVMSVANWHTFQVLTKRHGRMRSLLNSDDFREQVGWHATGLHPYWTADDAGWPFPNVWLGVSVENQQWADIRIPHLTRTPAAVRFLSMEPLLGPVDLGDLLHGTERCRTCNGSGSVPEPGGAYQCPACGYDNRISMGRLNVDWVIVGGESGHGARPMHPDWVRSLRDQCVGARVPFLFKQWGAWAPGSADRRCAVVAADDGELIEPAADLWSRTRSRDELNRRRWAYVHRTSKKAAGRELDGRTWHEFPKAVTTDV
jgi:protein gp37